MTAGRGAVVIMLVLAVCFAGTAWTVRQRHDADGRRTLVMRAVAQSIGTCSLALSSEGAGTREPLEGPAGCLGEMAGGYCLHAACDVVTCPGAGNKPLTLELARAAP